MKTQRKLLVWTSILIGVLSTIWLFIIDWKIGLAVFMLMFANNISQKL